MRRFNSSRTVATRDIRKENIIADKDLALIEANFNENMERIDRKFNIVNELKTRKLDEAASDILRSQIVLIMSSMDFYIHEVVKYGIIKIFIGEREVTKKYNEVLISLNCIKKALGNLESVDWLEEEIIIQNTRKTYMACGSIENALFLISDKKIFDKSLNEISAKTGENKEVIKGKLKEIYQRRNHIAHESDRNLKTGEVNDISEELVEDYFNRVKILVEEIHDNIIRDI